MGDLDGMQRLEALPVGAEALVGRFWSFGLLDGDTYARRVQLLADGRIAGDLSRNETFWELKDGRLTFFDHQDCRSTCFEQAYQDGEGRLALVGPFLWESGKTHLLREAPPLAAPAEAPSVQIHRSGEWVKRRNLVLIRANEQSVHTLWPRDLEPENRSWDLCISWYGEDRNFLGPDAAEYRAVQNQQRQYEALHQLFHRGSPLWDYDYIAFPDDDVMVTWRSWNRLFAICREHRLELAQPALSPEGYITHPITRQDDRYRLRFVSFVESMIPIFSRRALELCVGTFAQSRSGFGLDHVWPKLLGDPRDRIAVIDAVPVTHTRPQGGGYNIEAAIEEGNRLQELYQAPGRVLEYGGIRAHPFDRQRSSWPPPPPLYSAISAP